MDRITAKQKILEPNDFLQGPICYTDLYKPNGGVGPLSEKAPCPGHHRYANASDNGNNATFPLQPSDSMLLEFTVTGEQRFYDLVQKGCKNV